MTVALERVYSLLKRMPLGDAIVTYLELELEFKGRTAINVFEIAQALEIDFKKMKTLANTLPLLVQGNRVIVQGSDVRLPESSPRAAREQPDVSPTSAREQPESSPNLARLQPEPSPTSGRPVPDDANAAPRAGARTLSGFSSSGFDVSPNQELHTHQRESVLEGAETFLEKPLEPPAAPPPAPPVVPAPAARATKAARGKRRTDDAPPVPNARLTARHDFLPMWERLLESRAKRGKPASSIAQDLMLERLESWLTSGFDPVSIIADAVAGDWTTLYAKAHNRFGYEPLDDAKPRVARSLSAPSPRRPRVDLDDTERFVRRD